MKIAVLLKGLVGVLSKRQLVHKLGAVAIFFGLSTSANAQTFATPVSNPFGLTTNSSLGGLCEADLDNDGDLDLIVGGYYGSISYYENTGTATNPSFAAPVAGAFGLGSTTYYYAFLTGADIENDGDLDLLAGVYYGGNLYYENTGTAAAPAFATPLANAFGLTANPGVAFYEMIDMDAGGDLDVMTHLYYGDFNYYENTEFNVGIQGYADNTKVSPNPFKDVVTIESKTKIDCIEVYSVAGTLVYSEDQPNSAVNLGMLKSGIYMMHVIDSKGTISQKKVEKI